MYYYYNKHKEMYDALMNLCRENEAFFYRDHMVKNEVYRVFDYRLANYSDWLAPHARECRGTTFLVSDDTVNAYAWKLVSWPFEKFFNLGENPLAMGLDLNDPRGIMDKMDGSLIASAIINDKLWLKSKGALFSEQAIAANKLLNTAEYKKLKNWIEEYVLEDGATVMMEYTAPDNRIVLDYHKPALTVLGLRTNGGTYISLDMFKKEFRDEFFVKNHVEDIKDVNAFVESIPDMVGIEGFVLWLNNGERVKIKTKWYKDLHHLKDSLNSQKRLFEAVLYDRTDDLRASFEGDEGALGLIRDMEEKVAPIYNHLVDSTEMFYQRNKEMDRKSFAIKAKNELDALAFGPAMLLYSGGEPDYKALLLKNRKKFGIKDDSDPFDPNKHFS